MDKIDVLKVRIQLVIVWISVCLLLGKFAAFYITNSVGILTDAMESIVNVIAGFISLYSLHMAAKPKDAGHPFGHGKIELISASIEGILIIVAGGVIIYEGVKRLFLPSVVESLNMGIIVIAIAGVVNYAMGWYSVKVGKKYDSMALIAGGKHLQSDTYSTIGLVIGLILLYITKIHWIDSALALIFGGIIMFTGIEILRKTVANLMDKSDNATLDLLVDTISEHRQPEWVDIHNMKIVKYGSFFHIDCDLTVPYYYNIRQGHDSYEILKHSISDKFSGRVLLSVHLDPCKNSQCCHCALEKCVHRTQPYGGILPFTVEDLIHSNE